MESERWLARQLVPLVLVPVQLALVLVVESVRARAPAQSLLLGLGLQRPPRPLPPAAPPLARAGATSVDAPVQQPPMEPEAE